MRQKIPSFMFALSVLAACADTALPDDDSTTGPEDDDSTEDPTPTDPCAAVDGSGGSGAAAGRGWLTVPGFSTDTDAVPDYEVLYYAPGSLTGPSELRVLMTRPIAQDRAGIEQVIFDYLGQDQWAEEDGVIFVMPLPGPFEASQLGWYTQDPADLDYLTAALDTVELAFDVDRQRIHLYGTSAGGRLAVHYGHSLSTRIASIGDHAGSNPFANWPATPWARALPALLVHDEGDPIVSRSAMEDVRDMFLDAGAEVETAFDYASGHEWNQEEIHPILGSYFAAQCLAVPGATP